MPPLIEITAGLYPVGDDEPLSYPQGTWTDHVPRHEIKIAGFEIGQFPVTNAEWRLFQEADGYEDERWWDTEKPGERGGEERIRPRVPRMTMKAFVTRCREEPEIMDKQIPRRLLGQGGVRALAETSGNE